MIKRTLPGIFLALITAACTLSLPLSSAVPPAPAISPTASLTLTPVPSPTPTPTPTPLPEARVQTGDQALANGDYDGAMSEYQTALSQATDDDLKAAAMIGIGRVQYLTGDYSSALNTLRSMLEQYPNYSQRAMAFFFLGKTFDALKRYDEAAGEYNNYLLSRPGILDSYVQELRGDALTAAGNYGDAISAYQASADAPHLGDGTEQLIKVAQAYANNGEYDTAIQKYTNIYANTSDDYTKAEMDLLIGQADLALGNSDDAYTHFQDAVNNYPRSYDSYSALVALVNAGVEVNDLNRGLVDYFAGQYGAALDALNRYINADTSNDGTPHYYKALTLLYLDRYQESLDEWDNLIQNFRGDRFWTDAWDEKAYLLWAYLDKYDDAAQTLLDFVATVPSDPNASAYLLEAGQIYERNNELDKAAQTWVRVADEYTSSDQASQALIQAGVARYRLGDFAGAQTAFQRDLLLATNPTDQAHALLWVGKSQQAQNDASAAQASWKQAADLDPTGYYSERSRDLLLNRTPFTSPATIDLGVDLTAERAEADQWVLKTFNLPEGTDLNGLGAMASDPRIIRGQEFWNLGLYENARTEFEAIRQEVQNDPVKTYQLANYFLQIGIYRSAIFASRQVLTLAGLDDAASLNAPIYFNHIRFGIYYKDLVLPAAQEENIPPLFLYSVLRQESLFEGFVQSSAGARGLMQIIPSTGESIAQNLGWPPNFTDQDLYRPMVSVRLGTQYLAQQENYFDGDWYAALAAYNGGPGNAMAWKNLSNNDPDLLLEIIRLPETQQYIMNIYEIFTIYSRLYNRTP